MLWGEGVEAIISVMIVICQLSLPVKPVPLDFGDSVAGLVNQTTSVIHPFPFVDFPPTNGAGLVAHVIFVMIVILKTLPIGGLVQDSTTVRKGEDIPLELRGELSILPCSSDC